MKVKRFNNLWTMGLILCGAILVGFYIAKIFFPSFIVGVAEIPQIVAIGNYIDTHKWANHLWNCCVGILYGYILSCACCRTYKLNLKSFLILIASVILLRLVKEFAPQLYNSMNIIVIYYVPFIMCAVNNNLNKKTFISTCCCFAIDLTAQMLSLEIRNLFLYLTFANSATTNILLIDTFIRRLLLYLFFNYKNYKKEEN